MQQLLRLISHMRNKYQKNIPRALQERINNLYKLIVMSGLDYHALRLPANRLLKNKPKRLPGDNMLIRLRDYKSTVLRSLTSAAVPFTNNQAEQDIRMIKVRQKISGCFRDDGGAQRFCILRSYLSTINKHKQQLLIWLSKTFQKSATEISSDFLCLINTS